MRKILKTIVAAAVMIPVLATSVVTNAAPSYGSYANYEGGDVNTADIQYSTMPNTQSITKKGYEEAEPDNPAYRDRTDDDYSADTTTWTSVKWDDVEAGTATVTINAQINGKSADIALKKTPRLLIFLDSSLSVSDFWWHQYRGISQWLNPETNPDMAQLISNARTAGIQHIYFAIVRFPQLAISQDNRLNGAGEGMVAYYPDYNNTSSMWIDLLDDTARNRTMNDFEEMFKMADLVPEAAKNAGFTYMRVPHTNMVAFKAGGIKYGTYYDNSNTGTWTFDAPEEKGPVYYTLNRQSKYNGLYEDTIFKATNYKTRSLKKNDFKTEYFYNQVKTIHLLKQYDMTGGWRRVYASSTAGYPQIEKMIDNNIQGCGFSKNDSTTGTTGVAIFGDFVTADPDGSHQRNWYDKWFEKYFQDTNDYCYLQRYAVVRGTKNGFDKTAKLFCNTLNRHLVKVDEVPGTNAAEEKWRSIFKDMSATTGYSGILSGAYYKNADLKAEINTKYWELADGSQKTSFVVEGNNKLNVCKIKVRLKEQYRSKGGYWQVLKNVTVNNHFLNGVNGDINITDNLNGKGIGLIRYKETMNHYWGTASKKIRRLSQEVRYFTNKGLITGNDDAGSYPGEDYDYKATKWNSYEKDPTTGKNWRGIDGGEEKYRWDSGDGKGHVYTDITRVNTGKRDIYEQQINNETTGKDIPFNHVNGSTWMLYSSAIDQRDANRFF